MNRVGQGPVERDGRRAIHCFGDSHVWVFQVLNEDPRLLPRTRFHVHGVGGATALGLANPNSRTNALPTFMAEMEALPADASLLFMLGEVDSGFLVWLRSQQRGTTVSHELQTSLVRYTDFLQRVLDGGHRDVTITSVPLPTVPNYGDWEGLDNARKDVRATLQERTSATRWYSAELAQWAQQHRCRFLDLDPGLLDPQSGLVRSDFVSPDSTDHHYERHRYAELIADVLGGFGYT